jgi:hypothetical protein
MGSRLKRAYGSRSDCSSSGLACWLVGWTWIVFPTIAKSGDALFEELEDLDLAILSCYFRGALLTSQMYPRLHVTMCWGGTGTGLVLRPILSCEC